MSYVDYLNTDEFEIIPYKCEYYSTATDRWLWRAQIISRKTGHYELDYFTKGTALLANNGDPYTFEKGSVYFRKPGQINQEDFSSFYECYCFWFDVVKKTDANDYTAQQYIRHDHFFNKIPLKLPPEKCGDIKKTMAKLYDCFEYNSEYNNMIKKSLIYLLAAQLYHAAFADSPEFSLMRYHPCIKSAIHYIRINICNHLSIEEVAKHVGMSPKYFQSVFKSSTGKTPNHFINETRLGMAKGKLLDTDQPISEIAEQCGFFSNAYFSKVFKEHTGKTPKEFRGGKGD